MFRFYLSVGLGKIVVPACAISWQLPISLSPFGTSSYLWKSSARMRENVLERSKTELGAVTRLESTLLGNGGISIEDPTSLLFFPLAFDSFKIVQVL